MDKVTLRTLKCACPAYFTTGNMFKNLNHYFDAVFAKRFHVVNLSNLSLSSVFDTQIVSLRISYSWCFSVGRFYKSKFTDEGMSRILKSFTTNETMQTMR